MTNRQQDCDAEIQQCRSEMQRAEAARRSQEQESSMSEERRAQVEAEYEACLQKEQLRMDFMQESQAMHQNAMEELDKAIGDIQHSASQTLLEKQNIEQEIERCVEAIKKFQVLLGLGDCACG